ncbi:MAG: ribulokinase [Anaerolineaceae bacterium 4572_5.2]|nr:MAG: ribulokinase [Anaerolineaceae bacterium 4572_5.2]
MNKYSIGLDYGTASARGVLVDILSGESITTVAHPYADGVIDQSLPGEDAPLPADWALQNPANWLDALEEIIPALLAESGVSAQDVIGIGIDFTACTILPATMDGAPLCFIDKYRHHPHAWAKLWKHHAAQSQADKVNKLASETGESWLARYGGKISSEWFIPKALQVIEEAPEIFEAAETFVEGCDWVAWQLTGKLIRNTCAAGYKANWHKTSGFPSSEFLGALHPQLKNLYTEKFTSATFAPGTNIGGITSEWAEKLGLEVGTPVGAPIIDAHSATIGGGVSQPGTMFMIMGTSTCHMLMAEEEVLVEGISGVVEDGIVPGLFGYEAGQAGVGDIFGWFVENAVPPAYHLEADERGISLHTLLAEKASKQKPGESGLLALDWWNGNRSTLVDANEATAFGTRMIIEAFTQQKVAVQNIVAGGGLTKNEFLIQIYADITGREIAIAGEEQASALGAAILGAVAAGKKAGGYDSVQEAVSKMTPSPKRVFHPNKKNALIYEQIYAEYQRLYDYFGRGENNVMKTLRQLRKV